MGVGHAKDNQIDQLVLTKKCNLPELIFNQKKQIDRYFAVDSANTWQLSHQNSCFVCEKYCYTMFFYEQSKMADNSDLIQIQDAEFVKNLPKYLNLKTEKDKI